MHWFGELIAFYFTGLLALAFWLSIYFIPKWRAEKRVADLQYTQLKDFQRSFRHLFDANSSAIAELESHLYGIFPEDIRQDMLDAHEEASKVTYKLGGNR